MPSLQTAGHGGIGSISANGGRQNQNNLTLDGIGNVDTGNNGDQLATVSLDSVQEFRVLASNYQAEYGRSAQISCGTSEFHGSAYWFHPHVRERCATTIPCHNCTGHIIESDL